MMQKRNASQLLRGDVLNTLLKHAVVEKMSFLCQSKGSEMEPTFSANETLFVRKLLYPNARFWGNQIYVGDVVVIKDPLNTNDYVESNDSRTYGPISITNIVGRAIYRFRTAENHNVVVNSTDSLQDDASVLFVELDPAEVQLNDDKNSKGSQT
uniref:Peptidase S26 domain-containing protein n=1 Tax=Chenopodium quinoa TaxID=63459 RepID=A0A803LMQ3_CHEQI